MTAAGSLNQKRQFLKFKLPLVLLLYGVTLFSGEAESYMVGKNPHRRVEYLDSEGKYRLEWEVDRRASRITFNLTVETTGYVGFGLRARNEKSDADIVIGGVYPNGETYFWDTYSPPYVLPVVDERQDYTLHTAWENATHTFLSFSRDLDTCDPQDFAIVEDQISLMWAYSEKDELTYHHKPRGEFLVHLLHPDYTPPIDREPETSFPLVVHSPYNEDVRVWSWHVPYEMPRDHTTYYCALKRGPVLPRKHHMIGLDMRFNNPVSQKHLHHVIISKCRAPPGFSTESLFEQHVDQGQVCYGAGGRSNSVRQQFNGPIPTEYCTDYLHISGIGSRINFLPPHMGTPFGEDPHEYYLLQLHYDNPEERERIMVDINVDIFYTPHLRQNEGDLLVVRHESPGLPPSHFIPPFSIAQKTFAICGSECSRKMLPQEGIHVTAGLLHAHNSGVSLVLRHFRDGAELPPVMVENNFSPFSQQTVVLPKEAHILPGDQLMVECTSNNVWANETVMGGYSTRQEMCTAWLFYYNRLPNNHMICASEINSPEFMHSFLGIENVTWSTPHLEYVVTSPRHLGGLPVSKVSDGIDWTMGKREELNKFLLTHPHSNRCPVEIYARPHARGENGEPVDLRPEENFPVLTSLPRQAGAYKVPETCSWRANNDDNSVVSVQRNDLLKMGTSGGVARGNDIKASRGNVDDSTGKSNNGRGSSNRTNVVVRKRNDDSFGGWRNPNKN